MTTVPLHTPAPPPDGPGRAQGGHLTAGLKCRWCSTRLERTYPGARHGVVCPTCDGAPADGALASLPEIPADLLRQYLATKTDGPVQDYSARERIPDEAA